MYEQNGLRIGAVYDLEIKGRDFGKCLYLGRRKGTGLIYKDILARRGGEFVFGLVFDGYSLIGTKLILNVNRKAKISSSQREYLDERLKRACL